MDRGFNDDELADIMNEIESLEQEFTEEVHAKKEPEVEETEASQDVEETEEVVEEPQENVETIVAEQHEEPHHQNVAVLEEVSKKPVEEVVQPVKAHDDWKPSADHKHDHVSGAQTSMNFKVEGDMKLDLVFNISGHEVQLAVNENGLEIGLEGGAKFSVPLVKTLKHDKAA